MNFSATRTAALRQLENFIPKSGKYSRDRNHVLPGHPHVSQLSPAIRHRLLTEWEVAQAPLQRYAASTVEKFTQEIYWRSYWKGWLSKRPQVWAEYCRSIEEVEGAEQIRRGEGEIAVMNHFAKELTDTGYLHNHARMWFAAYWVHIEKLPWQLGARFFQDHLLDFDPASNTLSWRWVAGWQTPGKTYLPRRTNIEKYLHPDLLDPDGLERLEKPKAILPENYVRPPVTREEVPQSERPENGRVLWIHEEDLHPESSPLADYEPSQVLIARGSRELSELQGEYLDLALDDVAERASAHYRVEVSRADSLLEWAEANGSPKFVALRPEIGPLHDELAQYKAAGLDIKLMVRPEDLELRDLATAGFFGFWKKLQKKISEEKFPLTSVG